jgi:hypothetical protein
MLGSRRLIIQRAVTRLTRSGGSRPELRLLDAAAQAGIVSMARIRLDSGNLRDLGPAKLFKRTPTTTAVGGQPPRVLSGIMRGRPARGMALVQTASTARVNVDA